MLDWSKPLEFSGKAAFKIISHFCQPDGKMFLVIRSNNNYHSHMVIHVNGSYFQSKAKSEWDVINTVEKVKLNIIFGHAADPFIVTEGGLIAYRSYNPKVKVVQIEVEVPQ